MTKARKVGMIALTMLISACGKGGGDAQKVPEAPKRAPMELAPSPPMSSSDIDAIVNEQGGQAAPPPAISGNTSGEKGN